MPLNEHEELLDKGLELYDSFKYKKALPYLERAYQIAPQCISAMYNYANVLHMLDREEEAYNILIDLMDISIANAQKGCPGLYGTRGIIIDAHYLIFNVMSHGLGFLEEGLMHTQCLFQLEYFGFLQLQMEILCS